MHEAGAIESRLLQGMRAEHGRVEVSCRMVPGGTTAGAFACSAHSYVQSVNGVLRGRQIRPACRRLTLNNTMYQGVYGMHAYGITDCMPPNMPQLDEGQLRSP